MRSAEASVALAALVIAGLSGCVNFAEPEPGPGNLEAHLDIDGERTPRAQFRARFSPGGHPDGTVRSVENPRIRLLDGTVEPSAGSGALEWLYGRSFDPSAGERDRTAVELIGPRLADDRSPAVVTVPLVRQAGPETVPFPAGEVLELPLEGAREASRRPPTTLRWALSLTGVERSAPLFTARGAGSLPDTLRVQAEALDGAAGPLEASLIVHLETTKRPATSGSSYGAVVRVTVHLSWTIAHR